MPKKQKNLKTEEKKLYVLDTNIILHDHKCIHKLGRHDIVIPITVISELDNFKKGNEEINFNARRFMLEIDAFSGDGESMSLYNEGVSLGEGKGTIKVMLTGTEHLELVKKTFAENIPDHTILGAILDIKQKDTEAKRNRKVILVTKDVNLRLKAKSLGIFAEDLKYDKIESVSGLYTGKQELIEVISDDDYAKLYKGEKREMQLELVVSPEKVHPNEYLLVPTMHEDKTLFFRVNADKTACVEIKEKPKVLGAIVPRNSEQVCAFDALLNPDIPLVTLFGPAGTGKTLIAIAAAIDQLDHGIYDKILISNPIMALSNKDVGALPGDIKEKTSPFMQGIFDAISLVKKLGCTKDTKFGEKVEKWLKEETIIVQPLANIRGRSLPKCLFIVDETQNTTPHEAKTIITRAGEDTKIVLLGDIMQIDSAYLSAESNGLAHVIDRFKSSDLSANVHLIKGERSRLATVASEIL